ncbi:NfeD family protein [Natranaerobius trueperi]|uniref:Uncharacterized protein n=1 Tax=Natranaerobius trueperi TaxID=759412 RepID=A0A226BVN6_9FIRM|nr:nodulation protein NfeD [Natranaerobius trueperi]OWZ83056.1 hypothetical protein CDO51_10505 [Natranaerobius trueperi]
MKMGERTLILLIIFLLGIMATVSNGAGASSDSEQTVYVVPVEGNIERGLYAFMNRAFESAKEENADMILLDINTPGGTLDAAFDIKDLIVYEDIPVNAFVSGRAASAGAFLALAADELYMGPSTNMGAAEARMGQEVADEKVMSMWESEMRSVAEDRDPEIAAAMVRREIEINGLVSQGELLTINEREAKEHGMADGVVSDYQGLLNKTGFDNAEIIEYDMAWAERLARFITSPTVASILLTLGMAGLIIEITTMGFGVAGSISLLSFGLFFGGHIFAGFAGYEVLLFFLAGIVLLLLEAFVAGFGVLGLLGIVSFGFAITMSAENTQLGMMMLLYSIIGTVIILAVAFRFFVKSRFWDRIILRHQEEKDHGYVGTNTEHRELVGLTGKTETPLRPAGTARIEYERIDVVSEGGYIPQNKEIKITEVEGSRIVVQELIKEEEEGK